MGKKILVVDNNPVILRLLTHFLQKEGHSVKTAGDGLSALEVLQSFHPDILIIDLIMPQISGDKLCRIVSNQPKFDNTLIVILSSIAAEENIDFIGLGADACVAKGPAKEMLQNILTVFDHAKHGNYTALSQHVFGIDDVHERQITKELLEAKREFETTLQYMTDGFITLTSSAKIISANPAATQLFQTTEDKLLSTPFVDHFDKKYKEIIAEQLDKTNDQVSELGEEAPIILHEKYILIKFIPVLGQVAKSFIIFISDITKRKIDDLVLRKYKLHLEELVKKRTCELEKINENLQYEISERIESENKLKNVFNTSIPICITNTDYQIVLSNDAYKNIFNLNEQSEPPAKCYDSRPGSACQTDACPMKRVLSGEKEVLCEPTKVNDDGRKQYFLVTARQFLNWKGQLEGIIECFQDITDRKNAEIERDNLIEELKKALSEIKTLRGIIPICSKCHKIRNGEGYWQQVDQYITEHSEAVFSHGICLQCSNELYGGQDWYEKAKKDGKIKE